MPTNNGVWKHPNWPNFVFEAGQLASSESSFIKGAGINIGIASQLNTEQQGELEIESIKLSERVLHLFFKPKTGNLIENSTPFNSARLRALTCPA
ncbi:MAG: DUF4172 domain-containing protein [Pseudomonadales bacterium]|nr:DUF4172 domain-containing protein [Pseudomonadales bacterium]